MKITNAASPSSKSSDTLEMATAKGLKANASPSTSARGTSESTAAPNPRKQVVNPDLKRAEPRCSKLGHPKTPKKVRWHKGIIFHENKPRPQPIPLEERYWLEDEPESQKQTHKTKENAPQEATQALTERSEPKPLSAAGKSKLNSNTRIAESRTHLGESRSASRNLDMPGVRDTTHSHRTSRRKEAPQSRHQNHHQQRPHIPPRAPMPPRRRSPPPAPRPARLPTPDLPELGTKKFFFSRQDLGVIEALSKMDTQSKTKSRFSMRAILTGEAQAAVAYMKQTMEKGNKNDNALGKQ